MSLVIRGLNLFLTVLVLVINGLSVFFKLGKGQAVDEHLRAIGLEGGAVFIWLLIYLLMFSFSIYQMLPFTYNYKYINQGISPFFSAQAIANIGWVFARVYQADNKQWMDFIFVYLMFIILGLMYASTMASVDTKCQADDHPYLNYFFGRLWLSIYFAWTAGAVCTSSFGKFHPPSFIAYLFAASLFVLIAIVAIVLLFANMDIAFGLTVVWMAAWIAYSNCQPQFSNSMTLPLFAISIVFGSIVLFFSICFLVRIISRTIQRESIRRDTQTLAGEA
ncbi:hypothetical protein DSO57_1038418 [Entomophthora muscae]|uniref:Uncharacterized protein n=1 Tax=Entomophthora muscae TaxID=34485 RepID=A0ACC2SC41_9FUNG|nr:hypothetical protein DSO57_1038418 [Entomophthora muscae]